MPVNVELGVYIPHLVILSYVIASLGSFTGLRLATDIHNAQTETQKNILHYGGAIAFGAGIWSMHFIGMLAYDMAMVHSYNLPITFLSMIIAVVIAFGVLQIIRAGQLRVKQLVVSSLLLGTAICSMHYTGMAAMEMDADLRYTPRLFFLSVLIAITASGAALLIVFTLGQHKGRRKIAWEILAALVMGAAICGMHYTGMMSSVFIPYADCRYDPSQGYGMLAMIVAIISSAIFAIALILSLSQRGDDNITGTPMEREYSGNTVFIQLSGLLGVFMVLLVGSYFFFNSNITQQKNDSAVLNAASLQRMLIVRYAHHMSIITAAHATKQWDEVTRNNKAAQQDSRSIEGNYDGFLNGGILITSVDGTNVSTPI